MKWKICEKNVGRNRDESGRKNMSDGRNRNYNRSADYHRGKRYSRCSIGRKKTDKEDWICMLSDTGNGKIWSVLGLLRNERG